MAARSIALRVRHSLLPNCGTSRGPASERRAFPSGAQRDTAVSD
jgi:hypothetical protein